MPENQSQQPEEARRVDIGLSSEDEMRLKALNEAVPQGDDLIPSSGNPIVDLYNKFNMYLQSMNKIKIADKVTFFELLSVMINAGVPLIRALYVLSDQSKNVRLKYIIRDMAQRVEKGMKLSETMLAYPKVFAEAEVGMVKSGEATGKLNTVLRQIADQTQKSASLVSKVKGAMIYPIAVICIMIGALVVMLVVVVPKISGIFEESGGELPTSTKVLMTASDIAQNSYIEVGVIVAILAGLFWLFKQTKTGKYQIDNLLLRLPIFGEMMRKLAISRFARNLSSLMQSGIAIVQALEINASAVGNEVYKKRILMAAEDVAQGIPLGENLTDSTFLFPDMVVSMITIGEQTAKVDEVADKIADYYEEQVDDMISGLSKLLEPVILVVMGLGVGGLVAAVMQPIMSLTDVGNAM